MSKAPKLSAAANAFNANNINKYDPIAVARSDPYFKRNHMGKVTCTLCNVYCNDENAFIKHQAGKIHTLQLENLDRQRRKRQRIEEEVRIDAEKAAAAAKEKATRDLLTSSTAASTVVVAAAGGGKTTPLAVGRFGVPLYTFRTEHEDTTENAKEGGEAEKKADGGKERSEGKTGKRQKGPGTYQTRVWLDFSFSKAAEGTRPLHRWLSAREQHVESPADDYYVYLLVACESYTTVALKFPAKLRRTQEGDAADANGESVYRCWWDPVRKEYSMYFILSR